MVFKKAERKRSKARVAICGPSGSGKSYAALLLARGMGGKIAAIDTENGSLSLYSHLAGFDVLELEAPYTPERYIQAIMEAEKAGYDTIIIDSITHEWNGKGGVLDIHGAMPGNSWANWSKVTPRHQKFIDAMVQSKCHIIATMRTKTEYLESEKNGKKTIEKAGTAPQQRDGMDYEFTLCLDVQQSNHIASASKDRTTLWDGRFEKITIDHGIELMNWLKAGEVAEEKPQPEPEKPIEKPIEKKPAETAIPDTQTQPKAKEPAETLKTQPAPSNQSSEPTGKEVAEQNRKIRELAIKAGAKNQEEIRELIGGVIGRQIKSALELSQEERNICIAELEKEAA